MTTGFTHHRKQSKMFKCNGVIYAWRKRSIYRFTDDNQYESLMTFSDDVDMIHRVMPLYANGSVSFVLQGVGILYVIELDQTVDTIDMHVSTMSVECSGSRVYYKHNDDDNSLYVYDHTDRSIVLLDSNCINHTVTSILKQLIVMTSNIAEVSDTSINCFQTDPNESKKIYYVELPMITMPIRHYSKKYSDINIITV